MLAFSLVLAAAYAAKGSAVYKVTDGLDLVQVVIVGRGGGS